MHDLRGKPGELYDDRVLTIHEFVQIQEKLVSAATSDCYPTLNEFNLKEHLSTSITVDNAKWTMKVHGIGVMFINHNTEVIVDAHVGIIDSPNIFDAWRLVQYYESKHKTTEDIDSWKETLNELNLKGIIEAYIKYPGHYLIV